MKILTMVGTRPEIIRLSEVIKKLDKFTDHIIAHTGQNYDYELNEIFFDELGLRAPDYFLECAGETAASTIANVIEKSDNLFRKVKPDALLILGDTNSCLASISAKRLKIPIFHMEAGNRCFDMNVPEEINRKIVDSISDINLTYSSIARQYLIAEGFPADRIITTGSPLAEVIKQHVGKIENLNPESTFGLNEKSYILVSIHREENVDNEERLSSLVSILENVSSRYDKKIILSLHPRTKKNIEKYGINLSENILVSKPFGYFNYLALQKNSFLTISDSGTITEESNILKFDAINLRTTHERPEGNEEGVLIMTGISANNIFNSIDVTLGLDSAARVYDYSSENVSDKVLKAIYSYVGYVNRYVWKKDAT